MVQINSWVIKDALRLKHTNDFFLTEVKNGPSGWQGSNVRMDAMAIKKSWSQPNIIGYEIKVSRADFEQDHKWPKYYEQCHTFSFVCPRGLIQPEELPEDVGLIWYNEEKMTLFTKRKAQYRRIEMHAGLLLYIIMNRLDSERVPVYSDTEMYLQNYMERKKAKKFFGEQVGSKMATELEVTNRENDQLRKRVDDLSEYEEHYERVSRVLSKFGINPHRNYFEKELSNLANGRMDSRNINRIKWANEKLSAVLEDMEKNSEEFVG